MHWSRILHFPVCVFHVLNPSPFHTNYICKQIYLKLDNMSSALVLLYVISSFSWLFYFIYFAAFFDLIVPRSLPLPKSLPKFEYHVSVISVRYIHHSVPALDVNFPCYPFLFAASHALLSRLDKVQQVSSCFRPTAAPFQRGSARCILISGRFILRRILC